jgi:acyl transferase domain-containing protein
MISISGVAGAVVGPLPWSVSSLGPFEALEVPQSDWLPQLVERAVADSGRSVDELAWRRVGLYLAGQGRTAGSLAGRYDWTGPALGIDVECASGLVGTLLAADALTLRHCDLALVVAEAAAPLPAGDAAWDQACAPFAAEARQARPRSGAAVLVLERTGDARRRKARLLGGAHGRLAAAASMVGLNPRAIAGLLREGLSRARLEPEQVGYCEAHALGTAVGDAVELAAFSDVWRGSGKPARPTHIGSHKAGFGHLEAAAGLVGLARILAWFETGLLPPTSWRRPFSPLATVPDSLLLSDGGQAPARPGACFGLSQSGVGAVVFLTP